jgi:arylsulfatase
VFYAQALKWMDSRRQTKQPFFAYIPSNAPHGPYIARPEDKALYEGRGLSDTEASFFGMIHNIDENAGRLLAKLDEWGIAGETLVIFMNDNGGTAGTKVFNAGMNGSKGTPWLGGTRASSFWRWPGTLKPADCGALTAHIDYFRTLSEIAGATIPEAARQQVEGRSLVPLLENPAAAWEDRHLFTHLGRWPKGADPDGAKHANAAVRNTRWSLVYQGGKKMLFDLKADYGQKNDVAAAHPGTVQELDAAYDAWWAECRPLMVNENAVGPRINPFQELYYAQFGGSPTPQDLERMDPKKAFEFGQPKKAKKGAKAPE